MIDSWDWLPIGQSVYLDTADPSPDPHSKTQAANLQGSVSTRNFTASFLDSGRKWRRVVHLYTQSTVELSSKPTASNLNFFLVA